MTVRGLAWANGIVLVALAWFASTTSRVPLSPPQQLGRSTAVLAVGASLLSMCVLLSRRAPVASKILLAAPLVVAAAFMTGLLGAAIMGAM